jgi:hypothetical protein
MPSIPHANVKPGYRAQADDTSIDADVLMFALLRQVTLEQKAQRIQALDRKIRQLSPIQTNVIEDPISLARVIATLLASLNIPYYIGGSLASSLWGEPRYSEDLDLIIAVAPDQSQKLIQIFDRQFYVSADAVEDALGGRCPSFNVISVDSSEKVDLFISRADGFSASKMARRIRYPIEPIWYFFRRWRGA